MCSSRGLALSGVIACPAEELGIGAMSFGRMSSGGSCGLSCHAYGLECVKEDSFGCALMGGGGGGARGGWGQRGSHSSSWCHCWALSSLGREKG